MKFHELFLLLCQTNFQRSSAIGLSHDASQSQASEAKFKQFHKSEFLPDQHTSTQGEEKHKVNVSKTYVSAVTPHVKKMTEAITYHDLAVNDK